MPTILTDSRAKVAAWSRRMAETPAPTVGFDRRERRADLLENPPQSDGFDTSRLGRCLPDPAGGKASFEVGRAGFTSRPGVPMRKAVDHGRDGC